MSGTKLKLKITSSITDIGSVISPDRNILAGVFESSEFEKVKEMDELSIRKYLIDKLSESSTEKTEIFADGEIISDENGCELKYEQYSEDGVGKTLNRIVFSAGDRSYISVLRSGEVLSRMTFDAKRKYSDNLYRFPFGQIRMKIFTKRLFNNMSENGGKIEIRYILEASGGTAEYCELKIEGKKI